MREKNEASQTVKNEESTAIIGFFRVILQFKRIKKNESYQYSKQAVFPVETERTGALCTQWRSYSAGGDEHACGTCQEYRIWKRASFLYHSVV